MREINELRRTRAAAQGAEEWGRRGLQSLPAHVAVVDRAGTIMLVNRAWTAFAQENGAQDEISVAVGANYLEICQRAADNSGDFFARQALDGLRAVLSGERAHFSCEYPCDAPNESSWFLMHVAGLDEEGGAGAIISHLDISKRRRAEQAKSASEARFRAIFENAAVGMAELSSDGKWLEANAELQRILARPREELLELSMSQVTHPEDVDADAAHAEVLRVGAAETCTVEKRLLRPDGSSVWVTMNLSCVRKPGHSVDYFVAVINDISERQRAEERQNTLMQELAHRGKNLLAVVQSLANRSLSGDRTLPEAREAFGGRLKALASTYGVLTNEAFDGAPIDVVLNNEIGAFGVRAQMEGPSVILTVRAAQTFGLVAHELATNAAKYGALSSAQGHLRVNWDVIDTPEGPFLDFEWLEGGGPPARKSRCVGFGSTLLSRVAGSEFNCEPQLEYRAEGFRYGFRARLEPLGAVLAISPVRRKLHNEIACSLYDNWARQRGPGGSLPHFGSFDWTKFAATGALTIAKFEVGGALRFVEVGRLLLGELGRSLGDQDISGEDPTSMVEVYKRCAQKGEPCHELLRFDFGDDEPLSFERLLVPFSANGSTIVTHVVGVAIYDGQTRPQNH
jgi:PAS domain S-box-containing protein